MLLWLRLRLRSVRERDDVVAVLPVTPMAACGSAFCARAAAAAARTMATKSEPGARARAAPARCSLASASRMRAASTGSGAPSAPAGAVTSRPLSPPSPLPLPSSSTSSASMCPLSSDASSWSAESRGTRVCTEPMAPLSSVSTRMSSPGGAQ